MVHKILRNILNQYPYKNTHVQKLLPTDLKVRRTFALEFVARIMLMGHLQNTPFVNFPSYQIIHVFHEQPKRISIPKIF